MLKLRPSLRANQSGFSATELLMVIGLTGTILAIGFGFFRSAQATFQGDAAMRLVEWQLKLARETAINQRRAVEVIFTAPNFITARRQEIPNGFTITSTAYLSKNAQFIMFAGAPDTPDGFGNAAAVAFGAATAMMFTADGMFIDQAGNPVNGTIFIGQPGRQGSARAITVFGPTARIRAYRWNGTAWRQ